MGFRKLKTIQVSETVLGLACDALDEKVSYDDVNIDGRLFTFNNNIEQGFYLSVCSTAWGDEKYVTNDDLHVWVFEDRCSDGIVVVWDTEREEDRGMFSRAAYRNNSKYFLRDEIKEAADYVVDLVETAFVKEFMKSREDKNREMEEFVKSLEKNNGEE